MMNKRFIFLPVLLSLVFPSFSQMYILNEDFTGTNGIIPPEGWTNITLSGGSDDKWHFDNPGQQILNYPITEPFAIFDAEAVSSDGQPEEAALETPLFDASVSNFILLNFHHTFDPGSGGSAKILAFDGSDWQQVAIFTAATQNSEAEIVDLSSITGGLSNARLRFVWSGNGSGYWGLDNIRIYASQPLDGGVVSIDSPVSPVTPGIRQVIITYGNFGYNTITNTTIHWSANGVQQPDYEWLGSVGFGQTAGNIIIGSYDFQIPVLLKVWQSDPNGGNDPNPYNDTVTRQVEAALCGTYTLGGINPDFHSFSAAASTLNSAGITCPVTFLVRDGTYYDQFIIRDIPGTSQENTVTFQSESGDSTQAILHIPTTALKYEPIIYMTDAHHVVFQNIGFSTGSTVSYANTAIELYGVHNVSLQNCYFEIRNQFDLGVDISGGSDMLDVVSCSMRCISTRSGAIAVSDEQTRHIQIAGNSISGPSEWGYVAIRITGGCSNVAVENNLVDACFRALFLETADSVWVTRNRITNANDGIVVEDGCDGVEVTANRLAGIKSHQNVPEGTNGIMINNCSGTLACNNFIQTTGEGITAGITLKDAVNAAIHFNSVRVSNTDAQALSKGIQLIESSAIISRNNIFYVENAGIPVSIDAYSSALDFDRNDYYCFEGTIGLYNASLYTDLSSWSVDLDMDHTSVSVIPFYTSNADLSINQALLNNTGVPVTGIDEDIDGTARNPVNPDFGAREYDPCPEDAGINKIIAPQNPLATGSQPVIVLLQNQGTATLASVTINWSVNGQPQSSYPWSGSLAQGENTAVEVGSYLFQPGILYTIRSWTSQPNGNTDCNPINDTLISNKLAASLCGEYTIGGTDPDFSSFADATTILNLAGISCPVTFLVRDGIYREQATIRKIAGTSSVNTVIFRSESGDSTLAVLQIPASVQNYATMLSLQGATNVSFIRLGFHTGAASGLYNEAVALVQAEDVLFEGCNFELKKESDKGIVVRAGSRDIMVMNNRFDCQSPRAIAMTISDELTRNIIISGNKINGAPAFGVSTIRIGSKVNRVTLTDNNIENCYRAVHIVNSDSVTVKNNRLTNVNDGVVADEFSTKVSVEANRFLHVRNNPETVDGTSAVYINNATEVLVFNNFIHTTGTGPVKGINVQNASMCSVCYNSVNITNTDANAKSRGLMLKATNNLKIRNNIFYAGSAGTPVYIEGTNSLLDLDRNDYYSVSKTVGWFNGVIYYDMPSWVAATGMDQNSLSVDPFYTTETNLAINQAQLNGAGLPVAGIHLDIDGISRDPVNPDLGAKEYDPCTPDAGINVVTSPESPLEGGPEDVKVILQNQGTNELYAVRIDWSVNEELQNPLPWNGGLNAGQYTEITVGTFDFQAGEVYSVKVWTSQPNNTQDCNPLNDTAYVKDLAAPLCGSYTVGGQDPDFQNLSEAASVLNRAGIACPVTFLIRQGVYYEQLVLKAIPGSSLENTITFRSEDSDSSMVKIRINPEALKNDPVIYMEGSQYIRFEDLTIITGSSVNDANYGFLVSGARDITVRGCLVRTLNDSDIGFEAINGSQRLVLDNNHFDCLHSRSGAIRVSGSPSSEISVFGNRINGSGTWGNTLVVMEEDVQGVDIYNNLMEKAYTAIFILSSDSIRICGNVIRNVHGGISVSNQCSDIKVLANRLYNVNSHQNSSEGTEGIRIVNSTGVEVVNNFVHTTGTGPSKGISLQNADTCNVWYNSINIANTDAQGRSRGVVLQGISSVKGRDNILSVKALGIPIEVGQNVNGIAFDYNNYYQSSGIIGKINGITYTSLPEWGLVVNGDANSKVVNPYFKADTIPLPFQRALNGAGIAIPGVTQDIDGKARFSQAPDIGCLEFFVDYGILDLLSPSLNCFHPEPDSVIVYIRQYGDVPFNDLKVAYQMNNGPVHKDTIPGPHLEDLIHNFGLTEDITTYGDYLFKVWLINTLDDNINNDTLYAWRYSKPSPEPAFTYDNFCTGPKVFFMGESTVPEPYFIVSFEWLFGDSTTSTEQNPVHTYSAPGTYQVTFRAYSDAGCYGEVIKEVYINPDFIPLTLDFEAINETCLWAADGMIIAALWGGYPPVTLTMNGEPVTGYTFEGLTTGQYIFTATDSENCILTDTVTITSQVFMNPSITASPLSGNSPLTVSFAFNAAGAESWLWHLTESDTDTGRTPEFTFFDYGTHIVRLDVMSGLPFNCVETATIEIFVDVIITIEANNVFTPNGDGVDDFFEIRTTGIKAIDASIYNIWGNRVGRIEDLAGLWDGATEGGANAPDGTYFWSLQATGADNIIYERQGCVLLLRHAAQAIPNPARDVVQLKVGEKLEPPVEISVYSAHGALVFSEVCNDAGNIATDLSPLGRGVYFIRVVTAKSSYFVRVVKN